MFREQLSEALRTALKDKNQRAVSTLRLIMAALKDRDIAARGKGVDDGIDDGEILAMLQTMVKQRHEAIALYEKGARPELAAQEAEEIAVIERFLPEQLDDAEIEAAVGRAIAEVGASGLKEMGAVMGVLREGYAGKMDFGKAAAIVKARLGA